MSSDDININIKASDNASGAFKSVEQSMEKMAAKTKIVSSALRSLQSSGRSGAATLKLMGESMGQVRDAGANASASFSKAMNKMARSFDPARKGTKDFIDSIHNVKKSVQLSGMAVYYRELEKSGKAAGNLGSATDKLSGKSRVLTVSTKRLVDEMHSTKRSMPIEAMRKHYAALEKSSKASEKMANAGKKIPPVFKKVGHAVKETKRDFSGFQRAADSAASGVMRAFAGVGRMIRRTIIVGVAAATASLAVLGRAGIQYNGQMDTYRVTLTTYLRDADKVAEAMKKKGEARERAMMKIRAESGKQARDILLEAQSFAMKTPLDTTGVMKSVNLLVQYGMGARQAMDMTKQLADVSGGSSEKMHLLGLAFAQAGAKGHLAGEEMRQLTNAGYNPLKTIAKQTGKDMGELYKMMRAKEISVKMLGDALAYDTGVLGKFHGNVISLSKTLPGAIDNLREMGKAVTGKATRGMYDLFTKIAVRAQEMAGIFTIAYLGGKTFGESLDIMSARMTKLGGATAWVGQQLQKVAHSDVVEFAAAFKKGVQDQMSKGATFKVAVRTEMQKSEKGAKAVGILDGVKSRLSAFAPVVKGAMKMLGPMFEEVGKRVVKLMDAFGKMAPLFTNVIGPLIKGVFKGILSIIDPIISIIAWLAPWIGKLGTMAAPLAPIFEKVGYVIGMFFGGPILVAVGKFTKGFGIIGKVVGPVGTVIIKIGGFLGKILSKIGGIVKKVFGFGAGFAKAGYAVAVFHIRVVAALVGMSRKFAFLFTKVGSGFVKLITFAPRMYIKFVSAVVKMGARFAVFVAKAVGGAGAKFSAWIQGLGGKFGELVRKFIWNFVSGIQRIKDALKGIGASVGSAIGGGVLSIIDKVMTNVNKAIAKIEGALNALPGVDVNLGRISTGGGGGGGSSSRRVNPAVFQPSPSLGGPARSVRERRSSARPGTFSTAMQGGNGGATEIVVQSPVVIDGKEVANAVTRHAVKRMARA